MRGSGASSGEMPGFPFPFPGRPGRDPDEPLLDLILDGRPLPADAPAGLVALADGLAGLGGPAGPGAVPGEAAAMAAFCRSAAGAGVVPAGRMDPAARMPARRPPPRRRAARPARLAGGLLVVLAGLGSAAAYADVLPGPVQAFAHQVIGAPAPRLSPARSGKHQETTDRPGSHPPGSGSRHARPARPGQANGHHKAAEPGTANGNGRHRHRPPPATGHRRVKRPHPAPSHPPPSHPVPTPTHSA